MAIASSSSISESKTLGCFDVALDSVTCPGSPASMSRGWDKECTEIRVGSLADSLSSSWWLSGPVQQGKQPEPEVLK